MWFSDILHAVHLLMWFFSITLKYIFIFRFQNLIFTFFVVVRHYITLPLPLSSPHSFLSSPAAECSVGKKEGETRKAEAGILHLQLCAWMWLCMCCYQCVCVCVWVRKRERKGGRRLAEKRGIWPTCRGLSCHISALRTWPLSLWTITWKIKMEYQKTPLCKTVSGTTSLLLPLHQRKKKNWREEWLKCFICINEESEEERRARVRGIIWQLGEDAEDLFI